MAKSFDLEEFLIKAEYLIVLMSFNVNQGQLSHNAMNNYSSTYGSLVP